MVNVFLVGARPENSCVVLQGSADPWVAEGFLVDPRKPSHAQPATPCRFPMGPFPLVSACIDRPPPPPLRPQWIMAVKFLRKSLGSNSRQQFSRQPVISIGTAGWPNVI